MSGLRNVIPFIGTSRGSCQKDRSDTFRQGVSVSTVPGSYANLCLLFCSDFPLAAGVDCGQMGTLGERVHTPGCNFLWVAPRNILRSAEEHGLSPEHPYVLPFRWSEILESLVDFQPSRHKKQT